jgi:hypothetical protein
MAKKTSSKKMPKPLLEHFKAKSAPKKKGNQPPALAKYWANKRK